MSSTVLINGANSLIGFALVRRLLRQNYIVHTLVRKSSNIDHLKNLSSSIKFHYYELAEYDQFDPNFNVDVFFHLAWKGTDKLNRDNPIVQFENIGYSLSAVRLAKRLGATTFVGIGSQAEFAESLTPYNDDSKIDPISYYGIAKFAAGKATRLLCESLGIKHVWIRVFSVYGPYDNPNSLISLIIQSITQRTVLKMSDGNQIWDYMYSDDAADAIYLLSNNGIHGKSYSLGSGEGLKIRDYIEIIAGIEGIYLKVSYSNDGSVLRSRNYLVADINELYQDTIFKKGFDFKEGFISTFESYNKNK